LEEGQRDEVSYVNPSVDVDGLDPSLRQWRDYNMAAGLNMDVNMYDVEDMRMAYANDAIDWSLENNKFDEGVTKQDILGNQQGEGFNPERVDFARSAYADFLNSMPEADKERQANEEHIKEREAASRSLSIIKEYSARMAQDFQQAHENLLASNEQYRDEVQKISANTAMSKETKNSEITRKFMIHSPDYFLEKLNSYRDEILNNLPDGLAEDYDFLERLSEDIYQRTEGQMRLDLDKDGVYNEYDGILGGPLGWIASTFAGMWATSVDVLSGPIASLPSVAEGVLAVPALAARYLSPEYNEFMNELPLAIKRELGGVSESLRSYQLDYTDLDVDYLDPNSIAHGAGRFFETGLEMAPYIGVSLVPGGLFVTGFTNTYLDSKISDIDRKNAGLDPIFGVDEVGGEIGRTVTAISVGAIQQFSGGLLRGIGGRIVGSPTGTLSETVVARILGSSAGQVTKARAMTSYLSAQGIDAVGEGGQEFIEYAVQTGLEAGLGNSDITMSEFLTEGKMSFVEGARGALGLGVAGAPISGVKSGRKILGVSPDVVTGPQAAVNSIADPSSVDAAEGAVGAEIEGGGRDRETFAATESDIRDHKIENEKRYRVIKLRYPKSFERLQRMDERLVQMAHSAEVMFKSAEETGTLSPEETQRFESLQKDFQRLIEARQRLFQSFSEESVELTEAEATTVERAHVGRVMNELDLSVRQTREDIDLIKETEGTSLYDADLVEQKEQKLEELKQRQSTARKLLGELEQAHKADADARSQGAETENTSEAVRVAQRELREFLGVQEQAFVPESEAQTSSTWSAETQSKNHYADADSKGSTYTLDGVDQAGKPKASVSIFNERSEVVDGEMTEAELTQKLQEFYEKNKDILEGNEDILAIGTFYDAESGKTYIDISSVLDKEVATELGKEYNQISVWDLQFMKEIKTGGDGTVKGEMKPESERIADIRKMLGEDSKADRETAAENQAAIDSVRDTDQEVDKEAARENKGIEGQFRDFKANKDGSVGVVAEGPLNRAMAKWINTRLQNTIKNIVGEGRNVTIRVHKTTESGNYSDHP
jgi:hypothetical protein